MLVEIKSGASAADVYEGVGQLVLYSEMLKLDDCTRVLLLPFPPSEALTAATGRCGIHIHVYDDAGDGVSPRITFRPELLKLCGAAINQSA